jgi:hypothetical protein
MGSRSATSGRSDGMRQRRATATLQGSAIGLVAGIATDMVWQGQAVGWVSILAPISMGLAARLLADAVVDRMPLVTLAVAIATYWFGVLLFPIALAISGVASAAPGGDLVRFLLTLYAYTPAGLAFALPTLPAVGIAAILHVTLIHRRSTDERAADVDPETETEADPDRGRRFRRRIVALAVVTLVGIGIGAGMINSASGDQVPATGRAISGGSTAG